MITPNVKHLTEVEGHGPVPELMMVPELSLALANAALEALDYEALVDERDNWMAVAYG